MDFDPKLTKRHFRAVIYQAFIKLCEDRYPHIDIDEICLEAGLPRSYLEVESNWVSVIFANRFTKLLIEKTGNENISFDAGMQSFDPKVVGKPIYNISIYLSHKLLSQQFLYNSLPELNSRFSSISVLQVVDRGKNYICYRFTLQDFALDEEEKEHVLELYEQILANMLGYYSVIAALKKLPPPKIEIKETKLVGQTFPAQDIRVEWANEKLTSSFVSHLSPFVLGALVFGLGSFLPISLSWLLVGALSVTLFVLAISYSRQIIISGNAFEATMESLKETERRYTEVYRAKEKNERLGQTYKKFVPKAILNRLDVKDYEDLKVGLAHRGVWTAFFCDIRGFTSIAERKSSAEVFRLLNLYYKTVNSILDEHRGHLDSYAGDGFFAVFPEHPQDAVSAGIELLRAVSRLELSSDAEKIKLEIGVGVSTGDMILGTVGGENRMQVTHVSDSVNLAARLEALSKEIRSPMLIDALSFQSLDPKFKELFEAQGQIEIRGKDHEVSAWKLKPHGLGLGLEEAHFKVLSFKERD